MYPGEKKSVEAGIGRDPGHREKTQMSFPVPSESRSSGACEPVLIRAPGTSNKRRLVPLRYPFGGLWFRVPPCQNEEKGGQQQERK